MSMTRTGERTEISLPAIEDITRREFLIGGAAALLLGGCEGSGNEEDTGEETNIRTRTADTPRGRVEIPADPQRLVALYTHDLANALVLELAVIAGPGETGQPDAPFPRYLRGMFGEELEDVTGIAYLPEINFEQLAALNPDVILSGIFGGAVDDPQYERLEEIAPTVTYLYSKGGEYSIVPWRTVLRKNGEQFGREAAAEDWISRFEDRAADMRERLASDWSGATYAIVQPYADQVYVYGSEAGHIPKTLSDELGLVLAESASRLVDEAGQLAQGGTEVSLERLAEIDADILFVPVFAGPDGTPDRSIERLAERPLWSKLPAVRAGEVHEFTGDIFYESGPMAMAFLDVVERSLLEEREQGGPTDG
jgi:iron complex transport system substrate-binding protein